MTLLIPASDWDGVDTCNTCHTPLHGAEYLCELCSELVCDGCRDEIGGMTHCPECAQLAREFINLGEVSRVSQLPRDGQKELSQ